MKEGVSGLVSVEGEVLPLASPVSLGEEGAAVGDALQSLLDATHLAMKTALHRTIADLGKEGKLQ